MPAKFVCKRCKREYDYPAPGDRPIRCECGWWYENTGNGIVERFWTRIGSYNDPPANLFN